MTWSYIPNIDRDPYPVMSSCATQNSKEEYKGKPDKANAKIAQQKKPDRICDSHGFPSQFAIDPRMRNLPE